MSDRTQNCRDLSLHYCNNAIWLASSGTRACKLGLLWAWMVHEIFAWLAYYWETISYDYCIYQYKFLPQLFWYLVMICHYQVLCKQYDRLQVRHVWGQKTFSGKSDTYFYNRVCKQLFLIHYIFTTQAIVDKKQVFMLLKSLFLSSR